MLACTACGSRFVSQYYAPGPQPLVALDLPESAEAAKQSPRRSFDFHKCKRCGHVFNIGFDPDHVAYSKNSNLMFNTGDGWQRHLDRVADHLSFRFSFQGATVVDIGAGDGLFLRRFRTRLEQSNQQARLVAFEPSPEANTCCKHGLETFRSYFEPSRDLALLKPEVLICRHVIEHLARPRDFVEELAYYCDPAISPFLLLEVPCISKAVMLDRVEDYLYEHPQNFTNCSLQLMMEAAGWQTFACTLEYNDEVLVWCGRAAGLHRRAGTLLKTLSIEEGLRELTNNHTVAFWGGTGKGAAFLNAYNVTGGRVIDSDSRKAGWFVPGTGQLIESTESLRDTPVEVVVVTTRWRAADIYREIRDNHPCVQKVYAVDRGRICEYTESLYAQEK